MVIPVHTEQPGRRIEQHLLQMEGEVGRDEDQGVVVGRAQSIGKGAMSAR